MKTKGQIIKKIVYLRDSIFGNVPSNTVDKTNYDLLVRLLEMYFSQSYESAHFKKPDMYASNEDFAHYINDSVLEYMYWENESKMDVDWRDMYTYIDDDSIF